jgi:epoxide hydrolase 4
MTLDEQTLPNGITLRCQWAGAPGHPRLMLLHGFPQAAFIWASIQQALAGEAWSCAPNLRGYAGSSAPPEVAAYRPRLLVADLVALIEQWGAPLDLLVAHDWGGALAWNLAAQRPDLLRRLLIINAPHPATFLRDLRDSPAQQAASAYMNELCEPDAATRLAADDFQAMWAFFERLSPSAAGPGGWLDAALKARLRAVWQHGLDPMLNWYRASPLKPPRSPADAVLGLQLPAEQVTVRVPTRVVWGEADAALPPSLLAGLQAWVPELSVCRVPGASHWIVHERPELIVAEIRAALAR